jgi:hypothetical protein
MTAKGQRHPWIQSKLTNLSPKMPTPVQIAVAIAGIAKIATRIKGVRNVPRSISLKDGRIVRRYMELIPELERAISDIETILSEIEYLLPDDKP